MYHIGQSMESLRALVALGAAYQAMTFSAGEVIFRRSLMIARGTMSPPDAVGMVLEKATIFAVAAERAAVAAAKGGDPVRVATAALRPYGTKTKANVRRLRR